MLIGRIEGATHRYGQPKDWDEEKNGKCQTLPVRVHDVGGMQCMTSSWQPTPEELARLNAGAPVHLHIFSCVHPPVCLTVEDLP